MDARGAGKKVLDEDDDDDSLFAIYFISSFYAVAAMAETPNTERLLSFSCWFHRISVARFGTLAGKSSIHV